MSSNDPLTLAQSIGRQVGRSPGAVYLPGLEGPFLLKATGRSVFDDYDMIRTRRHSMLYGPPGVSKSTTGKFFLTKCIGAVAHGYPNPDNKPTFYVMSGSGTWEKGRGTFNAADGTIVEPRFCDTDYVFLPEYPAFLTHAPSTRADRIDVMNVAMEEGDMVVDLVKAAAMPMEKRLELAQNIPKDAKYTYEPRYATLYYDATCCFIGASRFFDDKEREAMSRSGHWSRWDILEWAPSNSNMKDYANDRFGTAEPADVAKLRQINEDLWHTEFLEVNAPPRDLVLKVVKYYNQRYTEMCEEFELKFEDVVGLRDDTDAAQLLAISAIARLASKRTPGDRSPIPTIPYDTQDVRRAIQLSEPRLSHLYTELLGKMQGEDKKKGLTMKLSLDGLSAYLENLAEDDVAMGVTPWPSEFTSQDFVNFCVDKKGKGASTVRRWLGFLVHDLGIIGMGARAGLYVVDPAYLKSLGFKEPEE